MKAGAPLRWLLVAFPLGLLVTVLISVWLSVVDQPDESFDPNEEVRITAASIRRKAVNEADFARDFAILTKTIGPRSPENPQKLEQAAIWIESMLGGANLGYRIERDEFIHEGTTYRNIVAELPGRKLRDEIIVVIVAYDSLANSPKSDASASAVAGMISLAQAYAGDPQGRTIRFVAAMEGLVTNDVRSQNGTSHYLKGCRSREERIVAILRIDNLGSQVESPSPEGFDWVDGMVMQYEGTLSKYWGAAAVTAFKGEGSASREVVGLELVRPTDSDAAPPLDTSILTMEEIPVVTVSDSRYGASPQASFAETAGDVRGLQAVLKVWANP